MVIELLPCNLVEFLGNPLGFDHDLGYVVGAHLSQNHYSIGVLAGCTQNTTATSRANHSTSWLRKSARWIAFNAMLRGLLFQEETLSSIATASESKIIFLGMYSRFILRIIWFALARSLSATNSLHR